MNDTQLTLSYTYIHSINGYTLVEIIYTQRNDRTNTIRDRYVKRGLIHATDFATLMRHKFI